MAAPSLAALRRSLVVGEEVEGMSSADAGFPQVGVKRAAPLAGFSNNNNNSSSSAGGDTRAHLAGSTDSAAPRRGAGEAAAGEEAATGDEEDGGKEYMTLKQRRAVAEVRRAALKRRRAGGDGGYDDEDEAAAAAAAAAAAGMSASGGGGDEADDSVEAQARREHRSLFDVAMAAGETVGHVHDEDARRKAEEAALLASVTATQKSALVSAKEHASGVRYTEPLKTDWRPPAYVRKLTEEECTAMRKKWHIIVQGEALPPPVKSFTDMRLPPPILAALAARNIARPTPIQVQGIPVALSGRDMIGIAHTGSGKTLVFSLPMIMFALQEEMRMPLVSGEGPIGIIMAPARELAKQTYDIVNYFTDQLAAGGYPRLRTMLAIGGVGLAEQMALVREGVHMIVATPGRLKDHLEKRRITLNLCRYIVLDEGDRMLDVGFDEDIQNIFSYFTRQRQTVIFSATMPKKIQDFARDALVKPVIVNVGRAGAANLDVVQEVEYVKQDAKIRYVLECLNKTQPPVLIFAANKRDVDDIHEYLLLKGVAVVSIHGDKSQDERSAAMAAFRAGTKDVLVATDVAAKGLDFPDIQHVINFDMPADIENYVHRIGRTGRGGKRGVATTFINNLVDEAVLLDLKHLLIEAKQVVPPALLMLEDPEDLNDEDLGKGCTYCGGLGHRIGTCPKLEHQRKQMGGPRKDFLSGGGEW